jgi:predicted nucleotidyltransferase
VPEATPPVTDFEGLIKALHQASVEFIVVGGAAATALGSARLTLDLDVAYARSPANLGRLVRALAPLSPYLRGAPPGLPFSWDEQTLKRGLNFTLATSRGSLDLLGEVTGGGSYEDLLPHSVELVIFGIPCRCLGLDKLIEVKRAAGRPKDLEAIAELEAIREERRKLGR